MFSQRWEKLIGSIGYIEWDILATIIFKKAVLPKCNPRKRKELVLAKTKQTTHANGKEREMCIAIIKS